MLAMAGGSLATAATLAAPERLRYKCLSGWVAMQMEQLGRGSHNPLEVTLSEPSDLALLIGHVLGELPPHPSGSRVASLSFLLDYLRKGGVSVGEVAPEDLAEKELVTVMKLTWRLAYHSVIKTLEPVLKVTQKDSERQVQKLVMDWIGKRIGFYPNVNTRSMSRDFSDGLLFCALLHKQNSKSIKWQVLDKSKRETNLEQAFRLFQELYKIPRLLEVEDMVTSEKIDKRALLIYVAAIIATFHALDPVSATPRGSRRDFSPPLQAPAPERRDSRDKDKGISPRSPKRPTSPHSPKSRSSLATALSEPYSGGGGGGGGGGGAGSAIGGAVGVAASGVPAVPDSLRFTGDQLTSVLNALQLLEKADQPVTARVSSANALPSASASASPPLVGRAFSDSAVTEPKEPPPERERRGPSPLAADARRRDGPSSSSHLESLFAPPPTVSVSPPAAGPLAGAMSREPFTSTFPPASGPLSVAIARDAQTSTSPPVTGPLAAATSIPNSFSGPISTPLSSSLDQASLLAEHSAQTPSRTAPSARPKSQAPPTEMQRQLIDFTRAVSALVKELRLAAPEAEAPFDPTRFARALNETVKSCRALVLLLPPEPNRRRVLAEAMMALSHAGRTFVDAAGLPESTERAHRVESSSRDFGQAIQTLAALVRSACQAAGVRTPVDEAYVRETEERVRAYLKSFTEACKRVLALAAVRPVSALDHTALADSLDALLRLGKTHPGQNGAQIDSLLSAARTAGLSFSAVARRGEGEAALQASETAFSSALETAIQATKASLSAEVQGARRSHSSSNVSAVLAGGPTQGFSISRIGSSERASHASSPTHSSPTGTPLLEARAGSAGAVQLLSDFKKNATLSAPSAVAVTSPSDAYTPPAIALVSPRASSRIQMRTSAADTPVLMHSMSRQRLLSEASSTLSLIAKDLNAKAAQLSAADVYKALKSAVYVCTRLLQDGERERGGERRDESEAALDLVMTISGAAQELLGVLKGEPVDAARVKGGVAKLNAALKAGAERFVAAKEERCSICDAKLTDKEIDSADKSKSAAICFKCSGPLGNMQTAFDQLMKSVQ